MWTAAVRNLPHQSKSAHKSTHVRSVEIMGDAAHGMLAKDSTSFTGYFFFDEDFLASEGRTDFSMYDTIDHSKL